MFLNRAYGTAPRNIFVALTFESFGSVSPSKKLGVPLMPALLPAAISFRISAACFPLSRHSLNFSTFKPMALACPVRSSVLTAFGSVKIFSCMSKYFPWSFAQLAASCALNAVGWIDSRGKSLNTYFTFPVSIYSFLICGYVARTWRAQYGHWKS